MPRTCTTPFSAELREICIFIKTFPARNVLFAMQCVPLVFQTLVTAKHDCPLPREATTRYRDLATSAGRCEISGSVDEMEKKKKTPIIENCAAKEIKQLSILCTIIIRRGRDSCASHPTYTLHTHLLCVYM